MNSDKFTLKKMHKQGYFYTVNHMQKRNEGTYLNLWLYVWFFPLFSNLNSLCQNKLHLKIFSVILIGNLLITQNS